MKRLVLLALLGGLLVILLGVPLLVALGRG